MSEVGVPAFCDRFSATHFRPDSLFHLCQQFDQILREYSVVRELLFEIGEQYLSTRE